MLKKIWKIINSPIGSHSHEDERLATVVIAVAKGLKVFYGALGFILLGLVVFILYAALS